MANVRVGVVGATGAVGGEILKVLDRAPWRPSEVVAMARSSTSVSHVEYGDDRLAVEDVAQEALDAFDLLFLAVPEAVALGVGEAALAAGVAVVDLSGAFGRRGDGPVLVPWVNPEAAQAAEGRVVSMPSAPAALVSAVLGPLARAGCSGRAHATVLTPASVAGRDGIDELSRQVVALFNAGTPPRKVFPQGLAFDLLPSLDPPDGAGWSTAERRALAEVGAVTRWPGALSATLVGVPVFSGISAAVEIQLDRHLSVDALTAIWSSGGTGVHEGSHRELPRPRRMEGQPFAQLGRLRVDDEGVVHLWASMDNLRATATAAVAAGAALLGDALQEQ